VAVRRLLYGIIIRRVKHGQIVEARIVTSIGLANIARLKSQANRLQYICLALADGRHASGAFVIVQ